MKKSEGLARGEEENRISEISSGLVHLRTFLGSTFLGGSPPFRWARKG
jgi:hypothetical protein